MKNKIEQFMILNIEKHCCVHTHSNRYMTIQMTVYIVCVTETCRTIASLLYSYIYTYVYAYIYTQVASSSIPRLSVQQMKDRKNEQSEI